MHGIAAYSGYQQFERYDYSRAQSRGARQIQPQFYQPAEGHSRRPATDRVEYSGRDLSQLDARSAKRVFAAKLLSLSGAEKTDSTRSGYHGRSALASRFLGHVANQLSNASSREEAQEILSRAREQIGEARSAVDDLGVDLGRRAERKLDRIENTLQRGLDNLEEKFLPEPVILTSSRAAVQYSFEAKASLDIKTRDGDSVSLSFAASETLDAYAEYAGNGSEEVSNSNVFFSSDSRLRIEINGDLDEEEIAAIKDVLTQIDNIAQRFFDGDIEKAISGLENFSFNDEELSSVGLDLALRQEINVAQIETTSGYIPGLVKDEPVSTPAAPPTRGEKEEAPAILKTDDDTEEKKPEIKQQEPVRTPLVGENREKVENPIGTPNIPGPTIEPGTGGQIRQAAISQVSKTISEHFAIQGGFAGGNAQYFVQQQTVSQILSTIIDVRDKANNGESETTGSDKAQETQTKVTV